MGSMDWRRTARRGSPPRPGRARAAAVSSLAAAAIAATALSPTEPAVAAPATTDVVVWADTNSDGTLEPALNEVGVPGVQVLLTDSSGAQQTATTGPTGVASFPGTDTTRRYRVDVVLPAGYAAAPVGADNGTTVQFVDGGERAEVGLQDPGNVVAAGDGRVFVSTFAYGDVRSYDGTDPEFPADLVGGYAFVPPSSGYQAAPPADATFQVPVRDVGSVYGSAFVLGSSYGLGQDHVFVSAYVKRHAGLGLGAGGEPTTGGIYRLDPTGASADGVLWADLDALLQAKGLPGTGAVPHPRPDDVCEYTWTTTAGTQSAPPGPDTCWFTDAGTFDAVGRTGLGDLQLSPSGDALFTVNLATRQLVRIELRDPLQPATAADVSVFDLAGSQADCPNGPAGDWRPFGLGVDAGTGQMLLTVTCTGETTYEAAAAGAPTGLERNETGGTAAAGELRALVYRFDPGAAGDLALVLDAPLDHPRRAGSESFGHGATRWHPWSSDPRDDLPTQPYSQPPLSNTAGAAAILRPAPLVSDVAVVGGDLAIGVRDLTGDRWGTQTGFPAPVWEPDGAAAPVPAAYTGRFLAIAQGDLLLACPDGTGTYALESNGACAGRTGAGAGTGNGPGGGEFFSAAWFPSGGSSLQNNFMGAAAFVVNRPDGVVATGVHVGDQPASAGVQTVEQATGAYSPNAIRLYQSPLTERTNRFGKANGLGALSLLSMLPRQLELGNRVWYDADGDGVQDASEAPVPGVTVRLYDLARGGALVGTTTTNGAGEYLFRSIADTGAPDGAGGRVPVAWTASAGPQGRRIEPHDGTRYQLRVDLPSDYAPGGALEGWTATRPDAGGDPVPDQHDADGTPAGAPASPGGPFPSRNAAAQPQWFVNDHTNDFGFFRAGSGLSLTKRVSGAALPGDVEYRIEFTCTLGGAPLDLEALGVDLPVVVRADVTVTVPGLPVGAVCSGFTEDRPAVPAAGASWDGPALFEPASVTIGASGGPVAAVTVTNRARLDDGGFTVAKTLSGPGAGAVPDGTTFTVRWDCGAEGAGTVSVAPGAPAQAVTGIAPGTSCRLTEDPPAPVAGLVWGPPTFAPSSTFTVAGGTAAAAVVVVDNPVTLAPGSFSVVKRVTGAAADRVPAGTGFVVGYDCGAGRVGEVSVTVGGAAVVVGDVPAGSTCTLAERTPPVVAGVEWAAASFTPSNVVTVTGGAAPAVQVVLENRAEAPVIRSEPPAPATPVPPVVTPVTPFLPATGAEVVRQILLGLGAIAAGTAALLVVGRRTRRA